MSYSKLIDCNLFGKCLLYQHGAGSIKQPKSICGRWQASGVLLNEGSPGVPQPELQVSAEVIS